MHETDAEPVVGLDQVEVALETAEPLQVKADRELTVPLGGQDVVDGVHQHIAVGGAQDLVAAAGDIAHGVADVVAVPRGVHRHEVDPGGLPPRKEAGVVPVIGLEHEDHVPDEGVLVEGGGAGGDSRRSHPWPSPV